MVILRAVATARVRTNGDHTQIAATVLPASASQRIAVTVPPASSIIRHATGCVPILRTAIRTLLPLVESRGVASVPVHTIGRERLAISAHRILIRRPTAANAVQLTKATLVAISNAQRQPTARVMQPQLLETAS